MQFFTRFIVTAFSGLSLIVPAAAQIEEDYTAPSVEDFAYLPTLKKIRVSPDGQKFSTLLNRNGVYSFSIFDVAGGNLTPIYAAREGDGLSINKLEWKRGDKIVFSIKTVGSRYGTDTVETRLMSMDPDGENIKPLFKKIEPDSLPIQIQDRIVSMLPNDPEYILVQYDNSVHRVPVDTISLHRLIQRKRASIQYWMADVNGEVRVGTGIHDEAKGEKRLILRLADDSWVNRSDRYNGSDYFSVIGVSDQPDVFYVLSNHETEHDSLYAYNARTDQFIEKLYSVTGSDVWGVEQDPKTGRAIGAYFADDSGRVHWLEETEVSRQLAKLSKALAGYDVSISSVNQAGNVYVVYADEGNHPGVYYLYNSTLKEIYPLGSQYPALADVTMGESFPVSYTARDGLEIPAYVTLPPGYSTLEEAKDLPFIIHPHGGPNARDFVGFDYWVQFLVSRGYGVLQMNFRGSSGYGQAFQDAGDQEWGEAMQHDISDGVAWLIAKGYADKDRLAILGGSYGGYASLIGAMKTPELYQCAISFAGVTDLPQLLRDAKKYVNGRYATRHIGNLWKDKKKLVENSPVDNAEMFSIPVLLMHGTDDRVVDVSQSRQLAQALKRAGKEVVFIELPDGDHHLSLYENRRTFLRETEKYLQGCFG